MAKLGSSKCRPLLLLALLLLLASIQAGPVMALDEQPVVSGFEKVTNAGHKALNWLAGQSNIKGIDDALDRGRKGWSFYKFSCKARRYWMDKRNSGGASGTPYSFDTLVATSNGVGGLGRGGAFSYHVTSQGRGNTAIACSPAPVAAGTTTQQLVPIPSNDVRITGIRVGNVVVPVHTAQPYAYLESSLYNRFRAVVIQQMGEQNPGATPMPTPPTADELCYAAAALRLPPPSIAILLASNNNVMQTMELSGATGTVWYREPPSKVCLRTVETLILGTP